MLESLRLIVGSTFVGSKKTLQRGSAEEVLGCVVQMEGEGEHRPASSSPPSALVGQLMDGALRSRGGIHRGGMG